MVTAMGSLRYKRVVIKLSGQAFAGGGLIGVEAKALNYIADELIAATELGVEVAVVLGGGNFFRGNQAPEWQIDQAEADNVGMLGTVMNGILLRGVLVRKGVGDTRLTTALPLPSMAEPFIRLKALKQLKEKKIVLLSCGIGQPYVTTDYPAVQRAVELNADAILLAKNGVDGIYDDDPRTTENARRYESLSYRDVLEADLRVMDQSAIVLARDHELPLHVFSFEERGAIAGVCSGEDRGTLVSAKATIQQDPAS